NELMSGSIFSRSIVSKLTLAFFYDSGWYDVDMSQAEPLAWGQNWGCDFVLKSCYEYMEIQKHRNLTVSPWCNEVNPSSQCLSDENAFGFCDLKNLGRSLGPQNQYFNELKNVPRDQISKYGGQNELADYCPIQTTGLPTNSFNITAPTLFVLIMIPKELGHPHDVLM
ncbi:leishmanolysin-like peptidase, partial [Paragonimus westermani]